MEAAAAFSSRFPAAAEPEARAAGVSPLVADPHWFRDLDATEAACRAYLEEVRWPDGVRCPRCDSGAAWRLEARKRFACSECLYQFSVTSGTLLHKSHAPFWKWLLAVELIVGSDGGMPANQLVRHLGGSYKTAWFIEHRIRAALGGKPSNVPARNRLYGAAAGCHHQMSVRYLSSYWAESRWREQTRELPDPCAETMAKLLEADPLEFCELVGRRGGARLAT
jgi:transposase-like protein